MRPSYIAPDDVSPPNDCSACSCSSLFAILRRFRLGFSDETARLGVLKSLFPCKLLASLLEFH